MKKIRVRFAPSPTGFIHVGNARTALFNWLFSRKENGVFILRIEDTDVERSTVESEISLTQDLKWLGIDWDEGPDGGGTHGPYRQSERLEKYKYFADTLLDKGSAYYCFCAPQELEREREEALIEKRMPKYSGKCRELELSGSIERVRRGEKGALRLKVPAGEEIIFNDLVRGEIRFQTDFIEDFVLIRSNGLPSYNYACVIDDRLMEITHVIRGEDHIPNTPKQIMVYRALGWEIPLFAHLSMVMGKDNTRLSKRHGATSLDQFREQGYLPEALFNYLALLGWAPPEGREVLTKEEMVSMFQLEKVGKASAIFDYDKLNWMNRQYIRSVPSENLVRMAIPFLKRDGIIHGDITELHFLWLIKAINSIISNISILSEIPKELDIFFSFPISEMDKESKKILMDETSKRVILQFEEELLKYERINWEIFIEITESIKGKLGVKGKSLFHPLRVAITARSSGLELQKFVPIVEEGANLNFPRKIKSIRERISEILEFITN
ncbi:MAG: glutamate--tRNA ligase [Acidobacteriota bacterium]